HLEARRLSRSGEPAVRSGRSFGGAGCAAVLNRYLRAPAPHQHRDAAEPSRQRHHRLDESHDRGPGRRRVLSARYQPTVAAAAVRRQARRVSGAAVCVDRQGAALFPELRPGRGRPGEAESERPRPRHPQQARAGVRPDQGPGAAERLGHRGGADAPFSGEARFHGGCARRGAAAAPARLSQVMGLMTMAATSTTTTTHYPAAPVSEKIETRTLAVIVDNEPGVLARVIGLFSGRGYNIDSLPVSETRDQQHHSRITVVTRGTPMVLEQIKNQLDRLVPVHRVVDMTVGGPSIQRELALVKVRGTGDNRVEALRLADAFRARVIDAGTESFV